MESIFFSKNIELFFHFDVEFVFHFFKFDLKLSSLFGMFISKILSLMIGVLDH